MSGKILIKKEEFVSLLAAILDQVAEIAREEEREKISLQLLSKPGLAKTKSWEDPRRTKSAGRAAKRTRSELALLARRFHSAVRTAPGSGVEYLAKQIGASTAELQIPIRMLVEEGKIKKRGQARAVKYYTSRQKA